MDAPKTQTAKPATGVVPPDAAKTVAYEPSYEAPAVDLADKLVLFVDCGAQKGFGKPQRLEDEIARRIKDVIVEIKKQPKYKDKDFLDVREVPYAEGTTALYRTFTAQPLKGVWSSSSYGLSGGVVEVLTPYAAVIVRGGR